MDNCCWKIVSVARIVCACLILCFALLWFLYFIICFTCVEFFSFYLPLSSSLLLLEESLELELELERLSSSSLSLEPLSGCFAVVFVVVGVVVDADVELKLLLSRCRLNDVFFFVCVFGIVIGREKHKKYKNSYKDTLSFRSLSVSSHCWKNTKQTNNITQHTPTHTHTQKK